MVYELYKCNVLQKLKQLGPLKEGDQRLVVNLSEEGKRLVMEKKGMINFLKVAKLLPILFPFGTKQMLILPFYPE